MCVNINGRNFNWEQFWHNQFHMNSFLIVNWDTIWRHGTDRLNVEIAWTCYIHNRCCLSKIFKSLHDNIVNLTILIEFNGFGWFWRSQKSSEKNEKKALLLYFASMSREQGLVIVVFDITEPHCWKSKYQHQHQQVIDQILQIQHCIWHRIHYNIVGNQNIVWHQQFDMHKWLSRYYALALNQNKFGIYI